MDQRDISFKKFKEQKAKLKMQELEVTRDKKGINMKEIFGAVNQVNRLSL